MASDNTSETAVDLTQLSKNESIKDASRYLRGTILEGLADTSTGALADDDTQLTKFHGIYQQDDRDVRSARRKAKEEPAYSFMIRVRVPGGVCTPQQWLEMDRLATTYGNETLKLTTRQAFQLHGVIKSELKKTIQEINASLMDTVAACGDVNRNVMCNPNPFQSEVHAEALKLAQDISDHLTPRTRAYHEIWLTDEVGEKVQVTETQPRSSRSTASITCRENLRSSLRCRRAMTSISMPTTLASSRFLAMTERSSVTT